MQELRQSTAVTVKMGPFLDSTDGNTTEEALTISQADIRLTKNGGAFAQTNNAAGATHDEAGWYGVPLDTTDTNTLGTLIVAVHESGALPVWREFEVVTANYWDSKYSTAVRSVDVIEISGDATAANNAELFFDGTGYAGTNNVIPTVTTLTGHTAQTGDNFARIGAPVGASISADLADVPTVAEFNARTIAAADYFDPAADPVAVVTLVTTTTTNTDMRGTDSAALASVCTETRLAELDAANLPADVADIPTVAEFNARTLAAADYFDPAADAVANVTLVATTTTNTDMVTEPPTAAAIADAAWNETLADHLGAGSTGAALNAAGGAGDPWSTALPGAYGAGTAGLLLGTTIPATIADVPTVAEFEARTIAAADYFDPAADTVALVTLVTTTTTNTDMVTEPPTAAAIADDVWNETLADHLGVGSTGEALNAAGAAGDPWTTAIPGAYGAGSAGLLLGTTIPTTIADIPTVAEFEARTIAAADYFDPTADAVANVTLVGTTTTNTDMRGTDNAALAATALTDATWTDARAGYLDELAAANLPTDIADIPTVAEFNARTQPTADYFDAAADTVALVTTVTNLTNAPTAGDLTATMKLSVNAEVDTALTDYGANTTVPDAAGTAAALIGALNDLSAAEVNAEVVDALTVDTLADSYAADGAQPTIGQAMLAVLQFLTEKAVVTTTVTVNKPDGTTPVMTFTLDDGTTPTSITRAA